MTNDPTSPGTDRSSASAAVSTDAPHPRDLQIQEFGDYDVVIDARSPREFDDDHIPEAINLPVVDSEQYAVVGTMYKHDRHRAYLRGVADSLRNMADALDTRLNHLGPDARVLVYCFRGGKRSRLWADTLRTIGLRTDVLPGGWKRYRRWVREGLAQQAPRLTYRVLGGPTGCGKTRLLQALARAGEQVIDLEGLAAHRGSLIGAVPGVSQPGQKLFDSLILAKLRTFDPQRPVWVEAESKKIGSLQLPVELYDSMHQAPVFYALSLAMPERVRVWVEDFGHFVTDPAALIERLQYLVPLVGHQTFDEWKTLAASGQVLTLFERLMRDHYDPTYQRTSARHYARAEVRPIAVDGIDVAQLDALASRLIADR